MMKFMWILAAYLPYMILGDTSPPSEKYITSSNNYCNDINTQHDIDIEGVKGFWYGAEIITHHETEVYETVYDSCVVVFISEPDMHGNGNDDYDYSNYNEKNDRRNYDRRNHYSFHNKERRLKLVWDERGKTLQYTFTLQKPNYGLWRTSGAQTGYKQIGTMLDMPYNQFTGSVQVMKAVGNHLVLTFCESSPKSQMFTIILTRKPHVLPREDIQSVRNLLRRRGLSVQSVRKVCKNSATFVHVGVLTILTSSFVSLLSRRI